MTVIAQMIKGFLAKVAKNNPTNNTIQTRRTSSFKNIVEKNPTVASCMALWAKSVSSAKLVVDDGYGGETGLSGIFEAPNSEDNRVSFTEDIVYAVLRAGYAIVTIEINDGQLNLRCAPSNSVSAKFRSDGSIEGFYIGGRFFPREFTIPIRDVGYSFNFGLNQQSSKCTLVRALAMLADLIISHNTKLITSTPKLGGVILLKRDYDKESQEIVRKSIIEKFYDNTGYVPILPAGIEWISDNKQREVDYIKGLESIQEQIVTTFGIPSQLMNQDKNHSYNSREQQRIEWCQEQVYPFADRIACFLQDGLNKFFDAHGIPVKLKIKLDTSGMPGLNSAERLQKLAPIADEVLSAEQKLRLSGILPEDLPGEEN